MSYLSNYKIVINVNNFTNISMRRQGFAAIKIQLLDEFASHFNYAVPCLTYSSSQQNKIVQNSSFIYDNAFQTSSFPIQYLEQVYPLNQIVQFNFSTPTKQKCQNLSLRFSLIFQRLINYTGSLHPIKNNIETININLKAIESGIFHYAEGYFSGQYFSKFGFTCFCVNTSFTLSPYIPIDVKSKKKEKMVRQKKLEKVKSFGDFIEWIQQFELKNEGGLQHCYEKYVKHLRYNSQILQIRINQHYRQRRETIFKLPKFIKQLSTQVSQRQFFHSFADFNSNKLTKQGYQQQIKSMKHENQRLSAQIFQGMKAKEFDIQKLTSQFIKYDMQMKSWRMNKSVEFGQTEYTEQQNAKDIIQKINKMRKSKANENSYPIQIESSCKQVCIDYKIWYSPQTTINHVYNFANNINLSYPQQKMILVLCHGYQSSASDMRVIKRGMKAALPRASLLVAKSYQTMTQASIDQMGYKLANQILQYFSQNMINTKNMILNFVGFSMGGVIARASLKHLTQFQNKFGFYCSIGTPHLGYLNGGVTKAGLWLMRNFVNKHCTSLDQLAMYQNTIPQESFIYKLSKQGSLKKFKKIILISSSQDKYVPWHSARICEYKKKKKNNYELESKMISNIIGCKTAHRLDINFGMDRSDVDRVIGRKAHINMLVQHSIYDLINATIPHLFDIRQS